MGLSRGFTVLHYRIDKLLGRGGMGEVYLAYDTRLNRQVAIKFLAAPDNDSARRRLMHEAQAAAGLDHPGVCTVYEVGSDAACGDFVVMQYVEGEPLSDRLRRGRLEPDDALRVAEQIAEALIAAHDHGIVHRDLKPQNVIITPSGRPKLLDFGIAKRALSATAAAEALTSTALTQPHEIVGTPGYMAPEQIRNGPVDQRADVFALGCVLYECLTGQRAFSGPTPADILGLVLHADPVPVSLMVPGLGDEFDPLCARLLQKNVQRRFQSAAEALGAIRALLPPGTPMSDAGRKSASRPVASLRRGHGRRSAVLAAVGLIAVIGAAVGIVKWEHRPRLHAPSPDARIWFDRGVTAIREGAYAGARASFEEAIRLDSQFVQAYARLADAESELDDERGAQAALLHVSELVPDLSQLGTAERLRVDAVRASVLREHDRAIAAYRQLADDSPKDPAAFLDLGRVEEAAYRLADARASYMKAIALDRQYAAAHARLGYLQGTPTAVALGDLDEAVRLYRTATDVEGEAEALLRKGVLLSAVGQYDQATQALSLVTGLTADRRYASQRLRAEFEMARIAAFSGRFSDAEDLGRKAVDEASASGWQRLAANGLVDLGSALLLAKQPDAAEGFFVRAIALASGQSATRTEMRAQLSQAALRESTGHPAEAVALAQAPLKFFSDGHYTRFEATAKTVLSRAYGHLEQYDDAARLVAEVLASADATGNDELASTALENLAGLHEALGRLPEALADRERIERIHRAQKDLARLPYDLTNRAELLLNLGRPEEAEQAMAEVDQGIAADVESYKSRGPRLALVRAIASSTAHKFGAVVTAGGALEIAAGASVDPTALYTRVLVEHALAELNRSRVPTATVAGWLDFAKSADARRQVAYWVADTLLLRGDRLRAQSVATAALAEPGGRQNLELRWRLEALVAQAARGTPEGANMPAQARTDLQRLGELWGGAITAYLARPDLRELRRAVQ